jgi:hypothetical protein
MSTKHLLVRAGLVVGGMLAAAGMSMAAEPTLHVPTTVPAQQQIDLLQRTQRTLTKLYATRDPQSVDTVAKAWYFPTGQANTVFVQLTTGELLVVEMSGNRIAQLRDLTNSAAGETVLATNR